MTPPAIDLMSVEFPLVPPGRALCCCCCFLHRGCGDFYRLAARHDPDANGAGSLTQTNTVLQRLAELQARVDATKVTISELGTQLERSKALAPAATGNSPGYQMAIRLAKSVARRSEDLMAGCGLSLAEAELVQRLHGSRSSSGTTSTFPRCTFKGATRNKSR